MSTDTKTMIIMWGLIIGFGSILLGIVVYYVFKGYKGTDKLTTRTEKKELQKASAIRGGSDSKETAANISFPNTVGSKIGMWLGGGTGILLSIFLKIYSHGSIAVVLWSFFWAGIGAALGYGAEIFLKRKLRNIG
jgi:hypothetical protein